MSDDVAKGRTARARLQLLAPPARPARPPYIPPRRMTRRPGERREPLSVQVPLVLAAAAAERQLDAACAAELCLERALVVADLAALGRSGLYKPLLVAAPEATVTRPLPGAKARYLQMLLAARLYKRATADTTDGNSVVDVPLRLFPRVIEVVDQLTASGDAELAEALELEIAAVSDGRTMCEWAALAALRLSL
jgi:hypothetical protein